MPFSQGHVRRSLARASLLQCLGCLLHQASAVRSSTAGPLNTSAAFRGSRAGAALVLTSTQGTSHAGGHLLADIGRAAGPTHYEEQGCWRTTSRRHEIRYQVQVEKVEACFAFCAKQRSPGNMGLSFFGVEKGGHCWCAAAYDGTAAGSKACNMPCQGDSIGGCGGTDAANIYVMYDCSTYPQVFTLGNLVGGNNLGRAALRVVSATETLKYSTMSASYRFVNVPSPLLGSKYLQGGNYKGLEPQGFTSNVPVTVYLAIDGRTDAAALAPQGFEATGDSVSWTDGMNSVAFPIFSKDFEAGQVRFKIRNQSFAGVFVTEQLGIQVSGLVDSSTEQAQLVDVSANRLECCLDSPDLVFTGLDSSLVRGGKYIRGRSERNTGDIEFQSFRPVAVFVAIDGQVDHSASAPQGFLATGGTLDFVRGSQTVPFHLYVQHFGAGSVRFHFRQDCTAGVFITEPQRSEQVSAKQRSKLLTAYGRFPGQSCGQDSSSRLELEGKRTLLGALNRCKMACWEAPGAMECHGFTYDRELKACTFHRDVLSGPVDKRNTLDCYFKIS